MIFERITRVRKNNGLSQTDFGKCLGVSRDVISNIENGRVEPKEPFMILLCSVFNINMDWLLTGEGEPSDEDFEAKKNINEAIKILTCLCPVLQEYAIHQMRGLLEVQKNMKE